MIDEKKLIEEIEKWMNDAAYLKEKYSGATQFKDRTGENIMYAHAEIAHDVISEVIGKINKQQKVGEWIPCSEALPPKLEENHGIDKKPVYLVSVNGEDYPHRALWNGRCFTDGFLILEAVAWMPLPEPYKGE